MGQFERVENRDSRIFEGGSDGLQQQFLALLHQGMTQANSESFLPQELDHESRRYLQKAGVDEATARQVIGEINRFGRSPDQALPDLMSNNRILAIGEIHFFGHNHQEPEMNPARELIASSIPALVRAGATHLAIEAPMRYQAAIDRFMETGDVSGLPTIMRNPEDLAVFQAARQAGLRIAAVDANENSDGNMPSGRDRNVVMANLMTNILNENPNNRIVFWAGSSHLYRTDGAPFSAIDHLRDRFSTSTVVPVYDQQRGGANRELHALSDITTSLTRPVVVSTRDASTLGGLTDFTTRRGELVLMRYWDNVVIFPRPRQDY